MKKPFTISRVLLFLALGGLISLSFLTIWVLNKDVRAYRESNQEAIHWSSAQIEVELSRFLLTLTRYNSGDDAVTAADVNERFDILWSRTGLFRSGKIGWRLRQHDVDLGTIPLILAKLEQYEPQIVDISRDDPAKNAQIIREFSALQAPLRRLSVKVLSGEQQRYAGVRRDLLSSSKMTFWVWFATLVIASVLFGVVYLESRRYVRQIRETGKLAEQALAADRAKARFLTMMSHELRTPMNGVMGLMALAKQSGLSGVQTRLIEQAERSGAQMVLLLNDILDFSDLQTESLELDRTAFEPEHLADSLRDALSDAATRNGTQLTTELRAGLPGWLTGDLRRLKQSLSYFATYMIEIVGSRDMRIVVSHDGVNLTCEIDVEAHEDDCPGWQPEAIFGHDGSAFGDFASDAVGPMIARGLIELMNGRVRLQRPVQHRASLVVTLPAEPVDPVRDCVRIEVASDTTALLVKAALSPSPWRVWESAIDPLRVHACLVEVGRPDEAVLVERLRDAHPGVRILGVGNPMRPDLFDGHCAVPVDRLVLTDMLGVPERAKKSA